MTDATLYKVTGPSGEAIHGGSYRYLLPPHTDDAGWTEPITTPRICHRGYHVTSDPMQWAKVGMRVWEAETRDLSDDTDGDDRAKRVAGSIRITQERPDLVPDWWRSVEDFVVTLGGVQYLDGHGEVDPAWKVYPTRAAARDAARAAARDAAWAAAEAAAWAAARAAARAAAWDAAGAAARAAARAAAWDAAGAASLVARVLVCDGLPLDQKHIDYAWKRWRIWEAGYGVAAEVGGFFYVYKAVI